MSREAFLAKVKSAIGPRATTNRAAAAAARLASPPRHPLPACAKVSPEHREAQLIACLESRSAEVIAVPDLTALPSAVEAHLGRTTTTAARASPSFRLVIGDDARLAALTWQKAPARWQPGDETLGDGYAAITHARAAVAETGTLVFESGAASPTSLAFLPEIHVVALERRTIVGAFEEAFAALSGNAPSRLPRAINLISSPSRTADVGGKLVKGAHGPCRLVVVLYGPSSTAP